MKKSAIVLLIVGGCQKAPASSSLSGEVASPSEPLSEAWRGHDTIETCFNGVDDNENGLLDEGCGIEQSPFQVGLSWDTPAADLDLLVVGPDQEVAETERATSISLSRSADCPDADEGECFGPHEHVFSTEPVIAPGTYGIVVEYVREDGAAPHSPVRALVGVRSGAETRAFAIQFVHPGQKWQHTVVFSDGE